MKFSTKIKKWLAAFDLKFLDPSEEQEYNEVRIKVIKDFALYVFLALALVMIPYSIRYFKMDLIPNASVGLGMLVLAIILFILRNKFPRCNEYIAICYLLGILGLLISGVYILVKQVGAQQAFYMGYAFAFVQRLVGYSIIDYKFMILFHIASIALKFGLLGAPGATLTTIVILLEMLTVCLSVSSEQTQRSLFHTSFKAKKDALKFKHLLTEFLPHQMTIFSKNYFNPVYINKSFKRTFKCDNLLSVKPCLEKLFVTKETIFKNKLLFGNLGISFLEEIETITFSRFISLISKNINMVRDLGLISITITEEDPHHHINSQEQQQVALPPGAQIPQAPSNASIRPSQHKRHKSEHKPNNHRLQISNKKSSSPNKRPDGDASFRSLASSGSHSHNRSLSSDIISHEDNWKKVYKAKLFMLTWDDEEEALAVMLDDVTKQKRIIELKIADKNKDLVIATVSHELRTPLNGMLGLLDIAKSKISPPENPVHSYLNACKNNGLLLLSLINSILDLSQIKNNKFKLVHSKISIHDLLNEIKALFEYSCVLKKLDLNIEIDPQIPKIITTDKSRLSQILINLLGNAFKFTFQGGITVRATLNSNLPARIKFSVIDTGIGIKQEDQKKLFKLFGRLDQEDKTVNTGGVGLGLTISTSLACVLSSSNQAGINLESEYGKGSTFSFVIDCQLSQAIQRQQRETSLGNVDEGLIDEGREYGVFKKLQAYTSSNIENLSKVAMSIQNPMIIAANTDRDGEDKRLVLDTIELEDKDPNESHHFENPHQKEVIKDLAIKQRASTPRIEGWNKSKKNKEKPWCLIVDDNPFNLMVASHIMEERNYQILTALNGKEAIEKVVQHKENGKNFQVILLDCQMPVMDGYEATRVLRKMMKANQVDECPIIALTANNRDEDHEKMCENAGMSGCLSKPLKADEMEEILKKLKKKMANERIDEVDKLIENDDQGGTKLL